MGIPDYVSDAYTAQLRQFREDNADVLEDIQKSYEEKLASEIQI